MSYFIVHQEKILISILFSILLFYFSADVFAKNEKWVLFHDGNSVVMYFSPQSLTGKGIKRVDVMLNFKKYRNSSHGKKIKSIMMVQNYDCTTDRVRLRSAINYTDNYLKGNVVSKGREVTPWQSIPINTPYSKLKSEICN